MREVQLKAAERKALEKLLAKRSAHAGHVRRARIILLSADGVSGREIAERVGISTQHVSRIRARPGHGYDGAAIRFRTLFVEGLRCIEHIMRRPADVEQEHRCLVQGRFRDLETAVIVGRHPVDPAAPIFQGLHHQHRTHTDVVG